MTKRQAAALKKQIDAVLQLRSKAELATELCGSREEEQKIQGVYIEAYDRLMKKIDRMAVEK